MANILEDVQHYVVGKLSADWQLSGCCQFLAESIKDIDYEIKNALGRQGIVGVCMTPKATYAGKFEDLFLAWTLEELEIDIVENVTVNRGKKNGQWMTGQQIALRVFDVLCPLSGEFEGQFSPVSIEEGEDNGLVVNKCILKALVYGEHGDVPQPEKPITYQFVKLLDQPPPLSVQPHDGWMWNDNGQLFFYVNHEAHKLGDVTQSIMSAYVESQISSKADLSAVPTKTSELSNDAGFIEQNGVAVIHDLTCDQLVANQAYIAGYATDSDLSSKADLSAVPTKTSQLSNDSGYITSADIITKRDLNDLNIYVDPMVEHTPIEVTVWHTSSISTLYILNWVETSWYYRDDTTTLQIYFDNYSNTYVMTGTIQDMGGTSHSISKSFDLTPPFWSIDFEVPSFYKIEVASVKEHIVTREYVDAHLSALESEIPTKTSDLSNDSGFITSADLPVKPVPFTIKQDRSLYPSSQTITVKTSPANTLSVNTNPNGNGGTFVASFLISEWSSSTTLADVVTAPDTAGCFVFKTSGQMNDTWGNLKTTLISSTESFEIALPL